jgi:hypothetical protein
VPVTLHIAALTDDERQILLDGLPDEFLRFAEKRNRNNEPYFPL